MGIPFRTAAGMIDLENLRPLDVSVSLVADSLAKINRYSGCTPQPFSVAAHSVLVSHLCPPQLAAWGLLHDAHEAFVGDITTPAVELLCNFIGRPVSAASLKHALEQVKLSIDGVIGDAWGVEALGSHPAIRLADRVALRAEMWVLLGDLPPFTETEENNLFDRATSWLLENPSMSSWQAARQAFVERAGELSRAGLLRLPAGADLAANQN